MRCPTCSKIVGDLAMHYRQHSKCGDPRAETGRQIARQHEVDKLYAEDTLLKRYVSENARRSAAHTANWTPLHHTNAAAAQQRRRREAT